MEAIGVFDSGVGGLTVVNAIKKIMPGESIIYVGDTARVPYGNKSKKSIVEFSINNVNFLLKKGVKLIVVACNTASAAALPTLKESFNVPIIGVIEAGAENAVLSNVNGHIGVIGTYRTIKSEAYVSAIKRRKSDASVVSKACPLFVPIIEENFQKKEATKLIIKEYLDELVKETKTLILGCTHYPLIKNEIKALYPELNLIDSAESVAKEVFAILKEKNILSKKELGSYEYYATDVSENFLDTAKRILNEDNPGIKEIHL